MTARQRVAGKIRCCGLLNSVIGEKFVKIQATRLASGELYPVSNVIAARRVATQNVAFDAPRCVNTYAMDTATRLTDEMSQIG